MLFNSYTFILFLTIVLILHYSPFSWRQKKINLLIASYLFYAAWSPPFVLLLLASTVVDWFAAKRLFHARTQRTKTHWLLVSLFFNLGMLGFFKYGNFLLENFILFMNAFGIVWQPAPLDIILPLGISFYTFQTLSYTIDIYRGKSRPWHSFSDYALYVTFFPQLVAGPIVRANTFLPQCRKQTIPNTNQFAWGISLIIIGLFQKTVLADSLFAPVVEHAFNPNAIELTSAAYWLGAFAFSGQIFCDFSGYSSAAIGMAICLGFILPDNFRAPYAATGFSDFWRRWHISLSSWLRDYLFIPLGGSRKGSLRTTGNLVITMFLGGLWHGASWNFAVWGLLHGSYLVIEHGMVSSIPASLRNKYLTFAGAATTFIVISVTWVFFRSTDLGHSLHILSGMLTWPRSGVGLPDGQVILVAGALAALVGTHWLLRNHSLEELAAKTPWILNVLTLSGMLLLILSASGKDRAFIYFQF